MAQYAYVDWPGLQYYHGKVTTLIDSRIRDCMKFGGEYRFEDIPSPDSSDLNVIIRVTNGFTVQPSNDWFDESMQNKTYSAGTLVQVEQDKDGVAYKLFMQPTTGSGGSSADLTNYYTIEEVDAKIEEALQPYATIESVRAQLEAIRDLLDAHVDNYGKLVARVTDVERDVENLAGSVAQLEEAVSNIEIPEVPTKLSDLDNDTGFVTQDDIDAAVEGLASEETIADLLSEYATVSDVEEAVTGLATKTDVSDAVKGLATEAFVEQKILEAELGGGEGGNVDLSGYVTKVELEAANFATESYVDSKFDEADVVGIDTRLTTAESTIEDQGKDISANTEAINTNAGNIATLGTDVTQLRTDLNTMDQQIVNLSQTIMDYGTF